MPTVPPASAPLAHLDDADAAGAARPSPVLPDAAWLRAWSWSFSRHRLLRACPRALYWRYWGSQGGWALSAPAAARRAWALRALTSIPALVGTAVHDAARQLAAATRDGKPLPSYDALWSAARARLNAAWRRSQADQIPQFWRSPTTAPALHEVVYRGGLEQAEVEGARIKLRSCLRHLVATPVLADLRDCRPSDVHLGGAGPNRVLVELQRGSPEWAHDWSPPGVPAELCHPPRGSLTTPTATVWTALDLLYRHVDPGRVRGEARGRVSGPTWCVVDWKTGAPNPAEEALQTAVYGLSLEAAGYPMTDGAYLGRVVHLLAGTDTWLAITARELAWARRVIAADAEREWRLTRGLRLPVDVTSLLPMPATAPPDEPTADGEVATLAALVREPAGPQNAFPLTDDRRQCRQCGFLQLCDTELAAGEA